MNKLDIFTVAVVFLCVLAIVFLLWRATGLFQNDRPTPADQLDADRIEQTTDTRAPEPRVPLDDNVSGEADSDLLDRAGEAGGNVIEGIGNAADRAGEGIDNAADRVRDALAEDDAAARRDGVREETRDLEIPESYDNRPGQFMIMGGSFGVYDNAINQRRTLRSAGFKNAEVTRFNGGKYAVVLVDRYERYSEARKALSDVRAVVPDAFVMRKRMGGRQ